MEKERAGYSAVAAFLYKNGYRLLPNQRRACKRMRAIALVSVFQQLTCSPQPHPFVRRVPAFGVGDLDDAWAQTRFLRLDFGTLMATLRIPETLVMENRGVCRGDEAFLVLLVRLSDATRLLDLMPKVGREYTQIYRMEKGMRDHLHHTWKHLLLDNWDFLAPRLATFNQHWLDTYQSVNNVPIVPLCHQNIALAMDGHKRPIPRPEVSSP